MINRKARLGRPCAISQGRNQLMDSCGSRQATSQTAPTNVGKKESGVMGPEQLVRVFSRIGVAGCLAALLSACGSKSSAPSSGSPSTPSATVTAVTISGPLPEIGATTQLTATAALSDGSKQDVTAQASWQTSNAGVITVSDRGVARGVGAGEADVSASYSGKTGSQHVQLASRTFTLAGTISEVTTGRPVPRAQVEILDGKNAGK